MDAAPYVPAIRAGLPPDRLGRTEDFLQWLALRQLVDQLVEVADVLHQRVCHVFDTNAADHALDQDSISIDGGGLLKERSEVQTVLAMPFPGRADRSQ